MLGAGGHVNQVAKIVANDGDSDDYFGCAVAVGETVVVGAYEDEHPNGYKSGSAYVFSEYYRIYLPLVLKNT
jgi:hypothetical protein